MPPSPSDLIEEPRSRRGTPVWEIARLFPDQGEWTEEQYLALDTNELIEFTDGVLEFLHAPPEPIAEEPRSRRGTPVWEIARLFPEQGEWTEEEYLALHTNQLIEFTDGVLEFLPVPTFWHQTIVERLFDAIRDFVRKHSLGKVKFAPLRVRLRQGKIREPDVVFFRPHRLRGRTAPPEGADVVVEVLSPGEENRERDTVQKRGDYAEGAVPEFWIVDPESRTITVLVLSGDEYIVHGVFQSGSDATSLELAGLSVSVDAVFAPES